MEKVNNWDDLALRVRDVEIMLHRSDSESEKNGTHENGMCQMKSESHFGKFRHSSETLNEPFLQLVRHAQMMCFQVVHGKIVPNTVGCPDALLRNYCKRPFGFEFDWLPPNPSEEIDCKAIFGCATKTVIKLPFDLPNNLRTCRTLSGSEAI